MLLVGNGRLITRDEAFPYAEDGAVRWTAKSSRRWGPCLS